MTDITEKFQQACQALPTTHVVKHPQSSYLDIMNALQLILTMKTFHPRTDTGLDRSDLGLPAYDPSPDLTAVEVCAVIDRLSALEMAWYTGSSLCQSIYTCLHYFHPENLGDSPSPCVCLGLRAYIAATAKCVEIAWKEFMKRHVYDMEDVWLDHYGLSTSMTDEVDEILHFCGGTLEVMERLNEETEGLISRLRIRIRAWLEYLHLHITREDPRGPLRDLERLLNGPLEVYEEYPPDGFDDNMAASLRQSIPLLPVDIPRAAEAKTVFREMVDDLVRLHSIPDSGDALWQAMSQLNFSRRPNALVLSIYKSTVLDKVDPDLLIGDLIERETGLPNAILHMLETGPEQARSLVMWRDLIRGCAISTLTVPILNQGRQRRDYSALSFKWYERAAVAESLGTDSRFETLARFCHAQRLDCLLGAALAAWDTELVIPGEEHQAWWWVEQVTNARLALGMRDTWRTAWARVWLNVASAMRTMLSVVPLGKGKPPSVEEFKLRHKWARKRPKSASGETIGRGLFPSYTEWKRTSLLATSSDEAIAEAKESLREASDALDHFYELAPDLGSSSAIQALRRDLSHNATTLEGGVIQWAAGSRNRWIPLLQR